jgi:hypothetical protein
MNRFPCTCRVAGWWPAVPFAVHGEQWEFGFDYASQWCKNQGTISRIYGMRHHLRNAVVCLPQFTDGPSQAYPEPRTGARLDANKRDSVPNIPVIFGPKAQPFAQREGEAQGTEDASQVVGRPNRPQGFTQDVGTTAPLVQPTRRIGTKTGKRPGWWTAKRETYYRGYIYTLRGYQFARPTLLQLTATRW